MRSMLTCWPSRLISTALSRLEDPMLMLTARFMAGPPGRFDSTPWAAGGQRGESRHRNRLRTPRASTPSPLQGEGRARQLPSPFRGGLGCGWKRLRQRRFVFYDARPPPFPPPCRGREALANSHPLSGEGWDGGECCWSNPRASHGSTRDPHPPPPPAGGGTSART